MRICMYFYISLRFLYLVGVWTLTLSNFKFCLSLSLYLISPLPHCFFSIFLIDSSFLPAYHIECIDKWLLRNNRVCPVCKRRVLPGGSDSESDDGHDTQTPNVRRGEMNAPNEDEDTNESSRLLVTVDRTNSADDNISAATISTILNNNDVTVTNETSTTNAQQYGDLSSMNNQMTVSVTSSQVQNQNLKSSSSRYGSISSSLNIVAATTSNFLQPKSEMFSY